MKWLILTALFLAGCATRQEVDLTFARTVTDAFASELQKELKTAIQTRGAVAAVEVCRDRAPEIAASVGRQHGAQVGRVTDRTRNPANIPLPWQWQGLALFAEESPGKRVEYLSAEDNEARYMREIRIMPLCTTCHGEVVAAPIAEAIERAYPEDRARGYQVGDLRGAFYVVWPQQ